MERLFHEREKAFPLEDSRFSARGTKQLVVNITAADEVKAKELFNHVLEKDEGITFK